MTPKNLPPIPVVVLAGGRAKPELEAVIGTSIRALAVVNGKTLLQHVLDGLKAAPSVGDIVVVGDVPDSDAYGRIPDGGDFVTNLFAGIERYPSAPYVLICTSDLPYLTGESVEDFVQAGAATADAEGGNLIYPIVKVERCYARFPGVKRTARKLKEGNYTGGNLVLLRPEFMIRQKAQIAGAYAARKSPARLAAMLGYGTLLRLLASQLVYPGLLSVELLQQRVSGLLGGKVCAIESQFPELATDFDKPSDFTAPSR